MIKQFKLSRKRSIH